MNNITLIEFILVGLIVIFQIIQAFTTFRKIKVFESIIPNKNFFKIKLFNIPIEDLKVFLPKDILKNLINYESSLDKVQTKSSDLFEVNQKDTGLYNLDNIEQVNKQIEIDYSQADVDYTFDNLFSMTIEEIKNKVNTEFSYKITQIRKPDIIEEAISVKEFYDEQKEVLKEDKIIENEIKLEDESELVLNEISLINPNEDCNSIFEGLLHSINVYLLKNKGATTDFNLIKDITERNIDTEDDDIGQRITTPLYLGLMGTMLGIIFGLVNLFLVSGDNGEFEVQGFLVGVSIAMSASFIGLFFTVLNSNFYKNARKKVEISKNAFYTFIQTELLPVLNQSVSSSVYMLHTNLVKFNDNFTLNINRLTGLLNKNYDAVLAQDNILQTLDSIDITEFAKANIKVLKELKNGTEDLHKFNKYLGSLNSTVDGTTRLSNSFQAILNKVNNFEGLAGKLDSRVEESNRLVQFLNDHYEVLSDRGDLLTDSVKKVDDVLNKSLVELRQHTSEKIEAIKEMTIREEDLMTKAFIENRNQFSKLSLLENLNKSINEIKANSDSQLKLVKQEITSLKGSIEKTNNVLNNISNQSIVQKIQNGFMSIKNIFKSKK